MTNNNSHGILLIYRHPHTDNAPALSQHINSFTKYSRYRIWPLNSKYGFPSGINQFNFNLIILHYTLFPFAINKKFTKFIRYLKSVPHIPKIAFFQDEYTYCKERFKFIDALDINTIYSLFEPKDHNKVYFNNTSCKNVIYTLAGYVDDELIDFGKNLFIPDNKRNIDIGYRARKTAFYLGKGGQEKTFIADEFVKRSRLQNITIDIKTGESNRFNGVNWYKFIANCRAMIGVEAGSSIVDLESKIRPACEEHFLNNPNATFDQVYDIILKPWEGNINHRAISPRVFECAAFRVCMILFEGNYSNIIKPMVHYIPLKKDFSNYDAVMQIFNDENERKRLTDNAYHDLIDSGKYSYQNFIREFDDQLKQMGLDPLISTGEDQRIINFLSKKRRHGLLKFKLSKILRGKFN